jgi:UDP-N-acetyl-2-amino-2-deoxyglucuronate dehydrogenase
MTIGFGIIGCGVIAPIHAEAIASVEDAQLIAVADVVETNACKLAEPYGAQIYSDYHEMLARDDIQAISLCVPSGLRAEIGEACAAAGKHILSEKPLEVTTERIDRLIHATENAGVLLGCIFQTRFAAGPQHVHRACEQGRFGKLVMGDAYIKWYRSQEYYDSGAWRGTRKLDGGGVLMNQGVHQIDLLLWFMGPVKRVTARTALVDHVNLEVEDLACALLEFENGAMGVVEGTTATWPGRPARVEVLGSDGSAVIEDGKLKVWDFRDERPEDRAIQEMMQQESGLGSGAGDPIRGLQAGGHSLQVADFVMAIKENRQPGVAGREGRRAVELIEAIYESATTGQPVELM